MDYSEGITAYWLSGGAWLCLPCIRKSAPPEPEIKTVPFLGEHSRCEACGEVVDEVFLVSAAARERAKAAHDWQGVAMARLDSIQELSRRHKAIIGLCRDLVRWMNLTLDAECDSGKLRAAAEQWRDGLAVMVGDPDAPEPQGIMYARGKADA